MLIRQAVEEDITALAENRWRFRTELSPNLQTQEKTDFLEACTLFLKERLGNERWTFWLVEQDGEIIANAFVERIEKVPNPFRLQDCFGYVTNVYTTPDWRNRGIGAALMEKVKEWARQQDLEMLILWPSRDSIEFYEREGFDMQNRVMELRLRV